MKALLTLAVALAAIAAAPAALAGPFITDTLGGNGHAKHATIKRYPFITDTLGGNGHAKPAVQGYRFIADTLAPGGGPPLAVVPSSPGFSWADAGVGAGTAAGTLIVLLGGTLLAVRRRHTLPL